MSSTSEVTLELKPKRRLDVIDVNEQIEARFGDFLAQHRKALYCSYHTTAGYLEQSLSERLDYSRASVQDFLKPYQHLFPPGANYRHDQLDLRAELSEEQRRTEPRNADSHLTFIGSGLENCVTYAANPQAPVYFIDLDGLVPDTTNGQRQRRRRTTVLGYNNETLIDRIELSIPVSGHSIDSINLRDEHLGLFDQVDELLDHYEIHKGRVDLHLHPDERHAGLTVNEDETLLMAHDLREVLRNPMRFMAEKGRNMLRDPRAIPGKAKDYAKYDLVQVINKTLDRVGLSESFLERLINKFMAFPAERYLRMKRSVSLFVSDCDSSAPGRIVQGRYQSPLLIQWRKAQDRTRRVGVTLWRFE